ncbi:hypothetical protein FOVG_16879 [Fusarium oxysporum f. sp. pisi HDV247]|uniref:Uncharacterized protein n=1 Tax=Fusarium oxysporum f. sp. pisi HDV247 TaxID=1080344 RepID=W9NGM2_FUSOX|nr:hypothetical protein FOVG_16879 [Fusarium oxysporum f. sp. pisi HDV247]
MHLLDAITKSAVEKSIMDSPDFSALLVPWFPSDLGESVCFNGAPIHSNCNVKDNFVCGNGSGYVSGFSNFTTWIGLILEVIWASVCFSIWIYGERSQLVTHNRSSTGTVWNVLGLAEAINTQLGNSTSAYGDERLRKELGDDLRFGYTTTASESRFPGRARINLVAVPEGSKPRCRIRLDFETEFG